MSFTSWLRNVRSALAPNRVDRNHRRRSAAGGLRAATCRPRLERLEDRTTPSFSLAVSYPAGASPQAIVSGHFNNDAFLDLAVANYGDSTVSVLLGNADGTFQPAQNYATGAGPVSVAVGDFNKDGKFDLATANTYDCGVSVLLGNGDGTFQAPTNIGIGSNPRSVAVGDFNGDGNMDLGVTSNLFFIDGYYYGGYPFGHYEGRANVLLGNGDGSFSTAPNVTSLGTGYSASASAAAANLNGDGFDDFVTFNTDYYYGYVQVLLGDSSGYLQVGGATYTGYYSHSLAAGDVNGDGKIDVVTANIWDNNISVLLGDGAGGFGAVGNYATGGSPASVVLGDFTGDGNLDVFTTNYYSTTPLSVLYGIGDGTFSIPVNSAAGPYSVGVAAGDFNGDGWLDAVTGGAYDVFVLINDGIWPTPLPSVSISDATVTEGNTGTTDASFTISLSAAYDQDVTVHYETADGSAAAGSDYTAASGDVTFIAGQTSQTITVLVNGDTLYEPDESFFINLTSPTNAVIADGSGTGIIQNDDPIPPSLVISDVSVTEGNTGSVNATFTVTLSFAYDAPVTVHYSTSNGTALAGSDYTAASGDVTFTAGQTSQTITVAVIGDLLNEDTEYFTVNLSNPTNAMIADGQGAGAIVDNNDPMPTLAVNDVQLTEGNSGTTNAVFTVSLSAPSGRGVSVYFSTANGTATAGSDYYQFSSLLYFIPGQLSQTVTIPVNGDTLNEANETFSVDLRSPTNGTLADAQGVGTILNDDPAPSLAISDVTLTEGNSGTTNFVFTVSLSAVSGQAVTVNFATANGTATGGSDYVATAGTLMIPAGQTSATITVLVNGDRLGEPNETFVVNLSSPTNASIADGQGIGTIVDNEPRISINSVAKKEGNSGTTLFIFTVTLSAAYDEAVTVNYATATGTAADGSDYQAKNGTLTFAPGVTTMTITIIVYGDKTKEADETFFVNLSGASSNAFLGVAQGIGTILDDDIHP